MKSAVLDYLIQNDFERIPHAHGKSLFDHSVSVYKILCSWKVSADLANAGLFHSCYGRSVTHFHGINLDQRAHVQQLIGEASERLAYLSCAFTEESFWSNLFKTDLDMIIFDRFKNSTTLITQEDFISLVTIGFANMIEHINAKNIKNFKWPTLSLFLQSFHLLPATAQLEFKTRFQI